MKPIPKTIYQTADEIEQRIRQRERDCMDVQPNSEEHRMIMQEIARLRIYADAKRWISGPAKQHA